MESVHFKIAQAGFLLLTAVCLVLILYGTKNTLLRMGWKAANANKRTLLVAAALFAWLAYASVLAVLGILSDFSATPPRLLLIILPPLVIIGWLTCSASFRRLLAYVPAHWLISLQVFRVPVEIFLWLQFIAGLTPIQMTFEGRNWDVLTGLTAPLVAWFCYGRGRNLKGIAFLWNILGLALLLNIVVTSILSAPSPFRVFLNEPANTLVAQFPIVLLPAVLVPLAYALHLFSLRKIFLRSGSTTAAIPVHAQVTPTGTPGISGN